MTGGRVVVITSASTIRWIGDRVVDVYGSRIGRATAFVAAGGPPKREWLFVEAGRFRKSHKIAPFGNAIVGAHEIWVPVERDLVMSSPDLGPDPSDLPSELFGALEIHYAEAIESGLGRPVMGRGGFEPPTDGL